MLERLLNMTRYINSQSSTWLVTSQSLLFITVLATPNSNQKRGARRARQNKSPALRLMEKDANANHIPQFQSTVRVKHHFRYQAVASAGPVSITRAELLNMLVVGVSSTQVARMFSGIKLNRVEIRALSVPNLAAGTDAQLLTETIEWTSSYGPSSEVSDSGTPLHPPLLITAPPAQSLASFWSLTGSNESDVLFLLNITGGAIMDVWVDAILQDGQSPTVIGSFTSTPTVGQVYALALDGRASNNLVPVSYTTTN